MGDCLFRSQGRLGVERHPQWSACAMAQPFHPGLPMSSVQSPARPSFALALLGVKVSKKKLGVPSDEGVIGIIALNSVLLVSSVDSRAILRDALFPSPAGGIGSWH